MEISTETLKDLDRQGSVQRIFELAKSHKNHIEVQSLCARLLAENGEAEHPLAQEIHEREETSALLASSLVHFHQSEINQAHQKIDLFLKNVTPNSYAHAYGVYLRGSFYMAQGALSTPPACAAFKEFEDLVEELNTPFLKALLEIRQGTLSFCSGDVLSALGSFESAIARLKSENHTGSYELTLAQINLGFSYRDLYGYGAAIPYFKKGLVLAEKRGHLNLKKKAYRELFFCFVYQNQYNSAYAIYFSLLEVPQNTSWKIEEEVFKAHLFILRKRWKKARECLHRAYQERRRSDFNSFRFDLPFHFAYLNMKQGFFAKAWSFMASCDDPVLRIHLKSVEFRLRESLSREQVMEYLDLASKNDSEKYKNYGQELLSYLDHHGEESIVRKNIIQINLLQESLREGKRQPFSFATRKLYRKLFVKISKGEQVFTKKEIMRSIFDFNHYQPDLHDTKIHNFVYQLNKLFKAAPFLISSPKGYILNPQLRIDVDDSRFLGLEWAHELIVLKALRKKSQPEKIQKLVQETGLSLSEVKQTLSHLISNGTVTTEGVKQSKRYVLTEASLQEAK